AAVLRTNGSIIIDSVSGNIDATGTDTVTYRGSQLLAPVNLSATDGHVLLYLPASAAYNIDFECGQKAQIQINKQDFHGENQGNRAKGTVGVGGMLLKARGEKGISCF
ncbi:MAG TPA: hypothetical protein VFJ29_04060, partial [Candidatus Kapabacteria bacterium]|nr:hypothetical protein [Candidatus Kapabacteria bacterium]